MSAWAEVAIAGTAAGYALVSRRLAATAVSAPMVFVGVGLALGPLGLDLLSLSGDTEPILALLEATLVLVLFTDALMVRPSALRRDGFLPLRLLGVGLMLTMGLGWLVAWPLLPGLTIWELALVAIVLTPTDGALGLAAITNPGVPPIVREGLNVESGLNDGMSLPFFVLALAAVAPEAEGGHGPLGVFVLALVVSTAIGVGVGWLGARSMLEARAREWTASPWDQLFVVAVAFVGYAIAVAVDGSGFIAAWVAGLSFAGVLRGRTSAESHLVQRSAAFAESLASLLTALSFLVFGAVLLGPALQHLGWRVVAYAVLSLTVIRLVPVVLALAGSRLKVPTVAYIGWFGPRGLASIVLGLLVVEAGTPGVALVGDVIALTVGISVLAHGASSGYLSSRYAEWYAGATAAGVLLRETSPADPDPEVVLTPSG
jgi:NhaP-type Na+/H+ or K+/H+ antiporter